MLSLCSPPPICTGPISTTGSAGSGAAGSCTRLKNTPAASPLRKYCLVTRPSSPITMAEPKRARRLARSWSPMPCGSCPGANGSAAESLSEPTGGRVSFGRNPHT